jgi:hypothetical protein
MLAIFMRQADKLMFGLQQLQLGSKQAVNYAIDQMVFYITVFFCADF